MAGNDGGFQELAFVRKYNEAAFWEEQDRILKEILGEDGEGIREGIPLKDWRALPDAPGG